MLVWYWGLCHQKGCTLSLAGVSKREHEREKSSLNVWRWLCKAEQRFGTFFKTNLNEQKHCERSGAWSLESRPWRASSSSGTWIFHALGVKYSNFHFVPERRFTNLDVWHFAPDGLLLSTAWCKASDLLVCVNAHLSINRKPLSLRWTCTAGQTEKHLVFLFTDTNWIARVSVYSNSTLFALALATRSGRFLKQVLIGLRLTAHLYWRRPLSEKKELVDWRVVRSFWSRFSRTQPEWQEGGSESLVLYRVLSATRGNEEVVAMQLFSQQRQA